MKDQQKQALGLFQKKYMPYFIIMRLNKEEEVEITAENTITLERFTKIIDKAQISSNQSCKKFDEPIEILECVHHSLHDIVLCDGVITIQYISGIMKKTIKSANFKLERIIVNPQGHLQLQLTQMQKKLTQKQALINDLSQKNSVLVQELKNSQQINLGLQDNIGNLKTQIEQKVNQNNELKIQRINLVEAVKEMEESVVRSQERRKEVEQQLSKQKQENSLLIKEVIDLKKRLYDIIKNQAPKINDCVGHHTANLHLKYYELVYTSEASIRIIRRGEDAKYYNWVNVYDVLPRETIRYKMRLTDIQSNAICVGFCTAKGLSNSYNFYNPESAYYACWGVGSIFEGGKERKINVTASKGDLLECEADILNKKVYWWKNGNQIFESELPLQMTGKSVYLSVILFYSNDSIDLYI